MKEGEKLTNWHCGSQEEGGSCGWKEEGAAEEDGGAGKGKGSKKNARHQEVSKALAGARWSKAGVLWSALQEVMQAYPGEGMHVSDADFDEVKRGLAKIALPETSGFRAEAARVLAVAAGRKPAIMACAMDFVQRASRIGSEAGVVTSSGDAEALTELTMALASAEDKGGLLSQQEAAEAMETAYNEIIEEMGAKAEWTDKIVGSRQIQFFTAWVASAMAQMKNAPYEDAWQSISYAVRRFSNRKSCATWVMMHRLAEKLEDSMPELGRAMSSKGGADTELSDATTAEGKGEAGRDKEGGNEKERGVDNEEGGGEGGVYGPEELKEEVEARESMLIGVLGDMLKPLAMEAAVKAVEQRKEQDGQPTHLITARDGKRTAPSIQGDSRRRRMDDSGQEDGGRGGSEARDGGGGGYEGEEGGEGTPGGRKEGGGRRDEEEGDDQARVSLTDVNSRDEQRVLALVTEHFGSLDQDTIVIPRDAGGHVVYFSVASTADNLELIEQWAEESPPRVLIELARVNRRLAGGVGMLQLRRDLNDRRATGEKALEVVKEIRELGYLAWVPLMEVKSGQNEVEIHFLRGEAERDHAARDNRVDVCLPASVLQQRERERTAERTGNLPVGMEIYAPFGTRPALIEEALNRGVSGFEVQAYNVVNTAASGKYTGDILCSWPALMALEHIRVPVAGGFLTVRVSPEDGTEGLRRARLKKAHPEYFERAKMGGLSSRRTEEGHRAFQREYEQGVPPEGLAEAEVNGVLQEILDDNRGASSFVSPRGGMSGGVMANSAAPLTPSQRASFSLRTPIAAKERAGSAGHGNAKEGSQTGQSRIEQQVSPRRGSAAGTSSGTREPSGLEEELAAAQRRLEHSRARVEAKREAMADEQRRKRQERERQEQLRAEAGEKERQRREEKAEEERKAAAIRKKIAELEAETRKQEAVLAGMAASPTSVESEVTANSEGEGRHGLGHAKRGRFQEGGSGPRARSQPAARDAQPEQGYESGFDGNGEWYSSEEWAKWWAEEHNKEDSPKKEKGSKDKRKKRLTTPKRLDKSKKRSEPQATQHEEEDALEGLSSPSKEIAELEGEIRDYQAEIDELDRGESEVSPHQPDPSASVVAVRLAARKFKEARQQAEKTRAHIVKQQSQALVLLRAARMEECRRATAGQEEALKKQSRTPRSNKKIAAPGSGQRNLRDMLSPVASKQGGTPRAGDARRTLDSDFLEVDGNAGGDSHSSA